MAVWKVRRIFALLLAVTFIVAGAVNGVQATDMSVRMTVSATDMPMPDGCNGCPGGDHGISSTACFMLCGGVMAVLPSVPPVVAVTVVASPAAQAVVVAGLHGPPDPYPPRPTILN
jgi:hypothetical protein